MANGASCTNIIRCLPLSLATKTWMAGTRSEEHTSELQSRLHLVCRLLLEKKKTHPARRPPPRPLHRGADPQHTPAAVVERPVMPAAISGLPVRVRAVTTDGVTDVRDHLRD